MINVRTVIESVVKHLAGHHSQQEHAGNNDPTSGMNEEEFSAYRKKRFAEMLNTSTAKLRAGDRLRKVQLETMNSRTPEAKDKQKEAEKDASDAEEVYREALRKLNQIPPYLKHSAGQSDQIGHNALKSIADRKTEEVFDED